MKKLIVFAFLILFTACIYAQSCQWARSAGGFYDDQSVGTTTDASGDVYYTGNYHFGYPITFGNTNLPANNYNSIFLVKYDPLGNVLWAVRAGNSESFVHGITSDTNGNIYIAGEFDSQSIQFGNTPVLYSPYIPWYGSNSGKLFIVKYSPTGNVIWSKCNTGTGGADAECLTSDKDCNLYLTGIFSDTIQIGNTPPIISHIINGYYSIYIAKYDSSGNALWAYSPIASSYSQVYGITSDAVDNIYITGIFIDTIRFGNTPYLVDTDSHIGNYGNIFIAKFDSSGSALWSKSACGTNSENVCGISSDAKCNIYLTGQFKDTIRFGNILLISNAFFPLFITKFDSSGNVLWAKSADNHSEGISICTATDKNIYLVGIFYDTIRFGNITIVLSNGGLGKYFIAKFDSLGNALWAQSAIGNEGDQPCSLSIDVNGNIYVTGEFSDSTIQFGNTPALANYPGSQFDDVFLVKYSLDSSSISTALLKAVPSVVCSGAMASLSISNGILGSGALWYWYAGICGGTLAGTGNILGVSPSITTTYYVRAEGTNNTTNCNSITITVNTIPALSGTITSTDSTPCISTFQTFSVINIPGATYTWVAPSTWAGTSTANSITYQIGAFNYDTVFVSATNSCGTSAPLYILVHDCALGISGSSDVSNFTLGNYPNPFSQSTTIEFNLPESGIVSIDIFNIFGERLLNATDRYFIQGRHEVGVNMSDFPDGIYTCRVKYFLKGEVLSKTFRMGVVR